MKRRATIAAALAGLAISLWLGATTGSAPQTSAAVGSRGERSPASPRTRGSVAPFAGSPQASPRFEPAAIPAARVEARGSAREQNEDDARALLTGSPPAAGSSGGIAEVSPQHLEFTKKFEGERADQAGSTELRQYFEDAFNDLDVDGAIDRLSCAETLCRVQAHFADVSQAMRFQEGAGMPERRRSIDMQLVDGQVDVEVYLAR